MRYMLTHEAYIGDLLTNKSFRPDIHMQVRNRGERDQYYIEGHHAPIVSREVFERVGLLVRRGLLMSHRVHFTEEEKALLRNAIDQDVENWRCESWQEGSDAVEAGMDGGAV